MRDRIVFFILGALLATLAYFAGDMQLSAHNPEMKENGRQLIGKLFVDDLMVEGLFAQKIMTESIVVGYKDGYRIRMEANPIGASIRFFHPNGKQNISLALGQLPQITGPEAAYLYIYSPNGKQNISLVTNDTGANDTGADVPFIVIVDDTGKARFMDTSSVNRLANLETNSR